MRLAYIDRRGYPCVVPVWFILRDGAYYVGTGSNSAKWKAIQRRACVSWVIDGGTQEGYKGASMRGRAGEVRDAVERAAVHTALGLKYYGSPEHPRFLEIFGQADDPETIYLQLVPEDGLTWEY